jgi:hypothetical protein
MKAKTFSWRLTQRYEAGLPEGTRVAAVNFESPSAYFSDYVLEELRGILTNNRRLGRYRAIQSGTAAGRD